MRQDDRHAQPADTPYNRPTNCVTGSAELMLAVMSDSTGRLRKPGCRCERCMVSAVPAKAVVIDAAVLLNLLGSCRREACR